MIWKMDKWLKIMKAALVWREQEIAIDAVRD
jgi:hypothetical protein